MGIAFFVMIMTNVIMNVAAIAISLPVALVYESNQFTAGEFFMYGIPASIMLFAVLGFTVYFLWPWMGMPLVVP
jgi:sodium-dependent dicarboxylate transporter 2/3/5